MQQEETTRIAERLIAEHLPARGWRFAFDAAKRRAGACDYGRRRITVSRYLLDGADEAEVVQVLLHEIAHALAGHGAAHGQRWRAIARRIGYTGSRLHDRPIAEHRATWVGRCPAGHEHLRFRRPAAALSCGRCSRRFSPTSLITWQQRTPPDGSAPPGRAETARGSSPLGDVVTR